MATLTATPDAPLVGQEILFIGEGFDDGATITLGVIQAGFESEIVADASGTFGTTDIADHATTTLTGHVLGTDVGADETVVIGDVTYTFKLTPGATANNVKIGTDAADTLANLKAAVNHTGIAGQYGTATVANPKVFAGALDAVTFKLKLHSKIGGTDGNSIVSTTTSTHLSFPGTTFNDGVPGSVSTGIKTVVWTPIHEGTYHATATDGNNEADLTLMVWQG